MLRDIRNFLQQRNFDRLEEAWMGLLEAPGLRGEHVDGLVDVARELIGLGESERAGALLELLLPIAEAVDGCPDEVLLRFFELLVRALPGHRAYRVAFAERFENLHGPTSAERAFFASCRVLESADPVGALDRLERLRRFLPGACVYHAAGWGLGEVVTVDPYLKQIVVNLEQKKDHRIAIDAVDTILEPLQEDSFRALCYRGSEELSRLAGEEPVRLVEKVLEAFGTPLPLKRLKSQLVPDVIPQDGWNRWWSQTKSLLRASGFYRVGDRAPYSVELLESAVSYEEDLMRGFRGTWSEARQVARTVVRGGSRKFPEAYPRVRDELERLSLESSDPLEAIEAATMLARGRGQDADAGPALIETLGRFKPGEIATVLESMSGSDDPERVLRALIEERPDEGVEVAKLVVTGKADSVRESGLAVLQEFRPQIVPELVEEFCRAPGNAPDAFCCLLGRHLAGADGPGLEPFRRRARRDLLVLVLDLMDHIFDRGRRGVMSVPAVRSLIKRLESLLVRDDAAFFERALHEATSADRREVHASLLRCAAHVPEAMGRLLETLAALYPDVGSLVAAKPWEADGTVYATAAGLARKKAEFRELMEEKLPKNFEAIGKAAAFGDLSENAEYTSALEERDRLTEKASRIKEELDRARVLGSDMVPGEEVGLGSKLCIEDLETGEKSTYSVLGPWDGGPDEGVLSYRSPLAKVILGHRAGEELEVDLPGGRKRFRILEVGSHFD